MTDPTPKFKNCLWWTAFFLLLGLNFTIPLNWLPSSKHLDIGHMRSGDYVGLLMVTAYVCFAICFVMTNWYLHALVEYKYRRDRDE